MLLTDLFIDDLSAMDLVEVPASAHVAAAGGAGGGGGEALRRESKAVEGSEALQHADDVRHVLVDYDKYVQDLLAWTRH
jgi:hypothetical protein